MVPRPYQTSASAACVNDGSAMRAKCTHCDKPFCDTCLAFTVNGNLWCEPCGNRIEEDSEPKWIQGLVLGGGIFAATAVLFFVLWVVSQRIFPILMIGVWGGAILIGWNRASPLRGSERPLVIRRGRALR